MIDEMIPYRIKKIYSSSTPREKVYLKAILEEIAATGDSQTYRDIWLSDYVEIPVDIDTFLCDDYYLGKTNRNGQAVYPYWREFLRKLFHAGNQYEEVFLTGATRIGKSSTAITGTAYMLYKLMCLRDPQAYFGKKDVSVFSILFFNLTKELASSVAYREFQDTILASPWFLDHGKKMGSEKNPYYVPDGGKVTIDYGSDAAHGLGKQVFCVVGSTRIKTKDGLVPIQTLVGKFIELAQFSGDHVAYNKAYIHRTKKVHITQRVTFSDGTVIEATPDHKIQVNNEEYLEIGNLKKHDCISTSLCPTLHVVNTRKIFHPRSIWVYDVVESRPYHNFIVEDKISLHNCGFMDEMNFSRAGVKDVSKAKAHMKDLYNTISARVKGTFRMNGEVYGKIFAVSSKRGDSDFMEAYMQDQINAGAGEHMLVADAPQWEVLPESMFNPGHFYIAVGDRHKKGFVVPDNQADEKGIADLKAQGYRLLTPPLDMKTDFLADFDIALRDLAGISVVGALSFITQEALTACINTKRRNPVYSDLLQIGTKDKMTIEEFFHVEEIPAEYKHMPMFIHLDLSLTTDNSGIGGVCINGRKDVDIDGQKMSMPTFGHAFSFGIKAPTGDKIPYSKIINFICWLRRKGFNIMGISRDQYQSEYVGQLLEEQGFTVTKLSLDRTPDGYIALRSVLLEQRIDLLDVQLLQDELVHLQRDAASGVPDHPLGGCFPCSARVRLIDGRDVPIGDLVKEFESGKNNWVYAYDNESNTIRPKRIKKAFLTKHVCILIDVFLDNGEIVECTPDHKFMLTDGMYTAAFNLRPGMNLMSWQKPTSVLGIQRRFLPEPIPVYDLTIEDIPNFSLSAGIFVHNSKDLADGLAGAVWNAIKTAPPIPVSVSNVAKAMQNINRSRTGYNQLPSMFSQYRRT